MVWIWMNEHVGSENKPTNVHESNTQEMMSSVQEADDTMVFIKMYKNITTTPSTLYTVLNTGTRNQINLDRHSSQYKGVTLSTRKKTKQKKTTLESLRNITLLWFWMSLLAFQSDRRISARHLVRYWLTAIKTAIETISNCVFWNITTSKAKSYYPSQK